MRRPTHGARQHHHSSGEARVREDRTVKRASTASSRSCSARRWTLRESISPLRIDSRSFSSSSASSAAATTSLARRDHVVSRERGRLGAAGSSGSRPTSSATGTVVAAVGASGAARPGDGQVAADPGGAPAPRCRRRPGRSAPRAAAPERGRRARRCRAPRRWLHGASPAEHWAGRRACAWFRATPPRARPVGAGRRRRLGARPPRRRPRRRSELRSCGRHNRPATKIGRASGRRARRPDLS